MESNRKTLILAGIPFVVVLILLQIGASPTCFWHGVALGIGFGLLTSVYLLLTWDPVKLRPRNPDSRVASTNWLPFVIIGGVISSRILVIALNEETASLVTWCLSSWVIWTLGYVIFQAWRHRPKNTK